MRFNSLLSLALFAASAPFAGAAAFNYTENFNNFGDQQNFTCPAAPGGVCGAVAAINSFIFLENTYPNVYNMPKTPGKLTPNYNAANNNDPTDANNFAAAGWQVGANPARQGYYQRTGTASGDYVATLADWFGDYAPGTSVLNNWYAGSAQNNRTPTVADLAGEIKDQEDVEFFVQNGNFYHVLTLTGISCNVDGACRMTWQDPNDPTNPNFVSNIANTAGQLSITGVTGAPGAVNITAAFSESPVPEPAAFLLLGSGIAALLVRRRLRH
jgi:hypothetical protein